jgi:hypothetical protein
MPLMAADEVHRDLHLTTPLAAGPDIKALQQALNRIAGKFPRLVAFELTEDRKLGEHPLDAAFKAGYIMGLARPRLNQIEKEHLIAQPVQLILRHPGRRNDEERKRAKQRCEALRKKLDQRPSLKGVEVTRSPGDPHWGGSNDVVDQYVEPFMVKRGLPIGSGKRTPAENKAVGGSPTSDHLTTQETTMGRDFPTRAGEDAARALAASMGFGAWQPNSFTSFTFKAGGHNFRAQILWGADIGHDDHVHVGIHLA